MIKLADILKEIEDEQIDLSALADLPGEIGDELKQASANQNEAVLTTIALVAAMPGIVKTTAKLQGIKQRKQASTYERKKTQLGTRQ